MKDQEALAELVHDVKSRCSVLSDAADALGGVPPERKDKLLALMVGQAEEVLRLLSEFARREKRP